ncbi:hypothetical protein K2Z84_30315 [Candidatus Binatia bacterium]|nr:hypothetical protein [Candidatus Binatia bacterium]
MVDDASDGLHGFALAVSRARALRIPAGPTAGVVSGDSEAVPPGCIRRRLILVSSFVLRRGMELGPRSRTSCAAPPKVAAKEQAPAKKKSAAPGSAARRGPAAACPLAQTTRPATPTPASARSSEGRVSLQLGRARRLPSAPEVFGYLRGALTPLTRLMAIVVPIAGVLLAMYLYYATKAENVLITERHRALGAIAARLDQRIQGTNQAIVEQHVACGRSTAIKGLQLLPPRPAGREAACERVGDPLLANDGSVAVDFCLKNGASWCLARLSLSETMSDLDPDRLFDEIVLLSRTGDQPLRVRWQLRGHPIGQIPELLAAQAHVVQPPLTSRLFEHPSATPQPDPSSVPDHFYAPAHTERIRWQSDEYLLFAQPVSAVLRAGPPTSHSQGPLVLIGLLRSERVTASAGRIPSEWVVRCTVLLLIALLSWPLIKLWNLGPSDRLTPTDLRVLTVGIVAATGIVTILLLAKNGSDSLRDRDRALREAQAFATKEQLRSEVATAQGHLAAAVSAGTAGLAAIASPLEQEVIAKIKLDGTSEQVWRVRDGRLGEDREKASFDVRDRGYFRKLVSAGRCNDESHFEPDIVHSKVTGRVNYALARCKGAGKQGALWVVGFEPQTSVDASTGAEKVAVVRADGVAVLHSTRARAFAENVFSELDDDRVVRAAISLGLRVHTEGKYFGEPVALYVEPLGFGPPDLSVVVFQGPHLFAAYNTEALLGSGWLFLAWLGIGLFAMLWIQILRENYRAEFLWPDRSHMGAGLVQLLAAAALGAATYAVATIAEGSVLRVGAMALLAVTGCVSAMCAARGGLRTERILAYATLGLCILLDLAWMAHGAWPQPIVLLAAWLTIALALHPRPRKDMQQPNEWWFRVTYVGMICGLTAILAIGPARQCFRLSWNAVTASLDRRTVAPRAPLASARSQPEDAAASRAMQPSAQNDLPEDPFLAIAFASLPITSFEGVRVRFMAGFGRAGFGNWAPGYVPAGGALAFLAVLVGVLWSVARNVFVLDADKPDPRHAPSPVGSPHLASFLVALGPGTPPQSVSDDLRSADTPPELLRRLTRAAANGGRSSGLEWVLDDTRLRAALLEWLEALPIHTAIWFDCAVDPLPFVYRRLNEEQPAPAASAPPFEDPMQRRWLRIAPRLDVETAWVKVSDIPIPDGDALYALLWRLSSADERRVLRQFVEEGLVNPGSFDAVRSLLHRGLITRRPAFEFVDEGLRRFVAGTDPAAATADEHEMPSDWMKIRRWLLAGAGLVGTVLVILAPGVVSSSVATLTALTGGLPALVKLFELLGESKTAAR